MTTKIRPSRRQAPAALRRLGQALSFLLLCAVVLAALALIVVPKATGSQTYAVLTSSMAPKYAPGTFLVVRPMPFDELRMGDVVTYQIKSGEPGVITHRVTGFTTSQDGSRLLITKGDNNDAPDEEPVREVQVRGKLLYAVPYVGFAANALGRADRGAALNLIAIAMIGYGIVHLGWGALDARRRPAGPVEAAGGLLDVDSPRAGSAEAATR